MGKICCIVASLCAGIVGSVLVAGCGGTQDGAAGSVSAAGKQFLLSQEPDAALEVLKARATLEESGEPCELVLVGRIDGLGQKTWDPDRAAFMLADLSLKSEEPEHDDNAKHDADNCPFCNAKKQDELAGLAMVEIVDANGNVPQVSAQELLGLTEGQTVVLRGKAKLDKLGTLVVRTSSIFVRSGPES